VEINLMEMMEKCQNIHASDLHLTVGAPPIIRLNGRLIRMGDYCLQPSDTQECVQRFLNEEQRQRLERDGECDSSVSVSGKYRFRLNIFKQRGSYAISMRNVDSSALSLEQLGLPSVLRDLTKKNNGIVLVTGPTGSGKSTTLATLIDIINHERDCHILTIEDPIEFLYKHDKSIVNQREIGSDTLNYPAALRAAMREDPDVILIGEMRDHESIAIALTAAETGHLVFSTLHTIGAAKTIDRIIDVFPPNQQQQIRVQLSTALQAVVSQQLIPRADGKGREVAVELMMINPAIRNLIRESKSHQINNTIATGASAGMITMDNSLLKLYHSKKITYDEMVSHCVDYDYIKQSYNG
jgi:twitching motility protein PilT